MSKADFLADIRAARAELDEILAARDERTLDEAVVPGLTWTAKEVLAHLIGYDQSVLQAVADVRAGRKWTWGWAASGFDDWNESTVGPRRGRSFAAVRNELEERRTRLLEELERWPDDAGPFGADTWDPKKSEVGWIASHEREHAEMIAKV